MWMMPGMVKSDKKYTLQIFRLTLCTIQQSNTLILHKPTKYQHKTACLYSTVKLLFYKTTAANVFSFARHLMKSRILMRTLLVKSRPVAVLAFRPFQGSTSPTKRMAQESQPPSRLHLTLNDRYSS